MNGFYEGRVFRPPSEAASLIVQSTIGCSHNGCAFCEMYKEKRFRARPVADVVADLELARGWSHRIPRIFFADGDAFVRRADQQLEIMAAVKRIYPELERATMYASPRSILGKTDAELAALRASGITMLYLGLETGSDTLLRRINKGATSDEIVTAGRRAAEAGFAVSVTAISGLAPDMWEEHADATAAAVSRMKPAYFSLLTLMLEPGSAMYDDWRGGRFSPMASDGILHETRRMLEGFDSEGTVFRANHASNYLNLRGTLNGDLPGLIHAVDRALSGASAVRDESRRRL